MGKQELKRKETAVVSPNGEGKQYEQTLTVDDTCLPSAEELTAYQAIDPNIVTFLMMYQRKSKNIVIKWKEINYVLLIKMSVVFFG